MSSPLNLSTYGRDLDDAYKKVLDPKSSIDWVLTGYIGRDTLKVNKMGSGLDDLVDEFSDGKIQYAFARVVDNISQLPKFVYIGWCGEGVPDKGLFTQHNGDVQRFFKGAHVSINARNDGDVDPNLIRRKVQDASGAKYSIHNEQAKPELPPAPVGSVYQKTVVDIPKAKVEEPPAPVGSAYTPVSKTLPEPKPLHPTNRFAQSSSATDKKVAEERAKREQADREAREREAAKANASSAAPTEARASTGDEARKARDAELEALRKARGSNDDVSAPAPKDDRAAREAELAAIRKQRSTDYVPDMNDRNDASSEKARREAELAAMTKARQQGLDAEVEDEQRRRDEARSNAGVPSAPSRAPVSAPPIAPPPVSSPAPPPVVDNRAQEEEEARRQQEEEDRERQRKESEDRARKEAEDRARKESEDRARREAEDRSRKEAEERARKDEEARKAAQAASAAAAAAVPKSSGIKAKAVYDYDKAEDNEISFADGEIITDIEKVDDGWWKGKNSRGEVGLFPATYVEEMASAPVPVAAPPAPAPAAVPQYAAPPIAAPPVAAAPPRAKSITAVAAYDYEAQEANELSFAENEVITDIEKIDDGWWKGKNTKGEVGLFPANYVEEQ